MYGKVSIVLENLHDNETHRYIAVGTIKVYIHMWNEFFQQLSTWNDALFINYDNGWGLSC